MNINILNVDEFCKDLRCVKNPKIFSIKNKFSTDGLFSQQIFGPVTSYTCGCNLPQRLNKYTNIEKCQICDVEFVSNTERSNRFAKIELPFEIINPFLLLVLTEGRYNLKKVLNDILSYNCKYLINKKNIKFIKYIDKIDKNEYDTEEFELIDVGIHGALKIIDYVINDNDVSLKNLFVKQHLEYIKIKNIIVSPPEFRPVLSNSKSFFKDDLNEIYTLIISKIKKIESIPYKINTNNKIYHSSFSFIQKKAIELADHIIDVTGKKDGFIRNNILGKRVDFSGRAVITPEPSLKINECSIPYIMLLEIYKVQITSYLIQIGKYKRHNLALNYIEDCLKRKSEELFDVVNEFVKDKYCELNRQPSLHRLSFLAFKLKTHIGNSIKVNPLLSEPFNYDHDGDSIDGEVNLYKGNNTESYCLKNLKMSKIVSENLFTFKETKNKENEIIVKKYKPNEPIFIEAISVYNGNVKLKEITEFSIHENIEMYKIEDTKERFKTIWSSSDHSLIVYDEIDDKIKTISPVELINNKQGKYLIMEN